MNIIRHGDILLKAVEQPKNLKSFYKGNSFVLALGETTGHKHLLTCEPTTQLEILEDEKGQRYLRMEGNGKLTHEEHKTLEIMPDFYVIGNEQEYDYFTQETNRVQD